MADFMVKLPSNFRYVPQFDGNSQYKCVESCLAMAGQFAYPDRYAHPALLMSQIYQQYVGPDVVGDRKGTTEAQALDWLHSQNIGVIDMQALLDNPEELHAEIQAQNKQGVVQIISIGDESFLKYAKNGQTLHNWADALNHGSHAMLRVGYSDSEGWAYYMEPAAAQNFAEPVPIEWLDFLNGKIVGCIAIMPPGVPVPPADFSYQHGTWPEPPKPKPVVDFEKVLSNLAAIAGVGGQLTNLANDIAKDVAALKEAGI